MKDRTSSLELTKAIPDPKELDRVALRLEGVGAGEILDWALETYAEGLTFSVSFGGAEGMVLLDMLWRRGERIRVYTLDTGFLFADTIRFRGQVTERYGMPVEVVRPELTVDKQAKQLGEQLYRSNPDLCCYMRKVEPHIRALEGYDAWLTGIRRAQTKQRTDAPVVMWESRFGIAKISPLASWSAEQVKEYIEKHDVPLNPLSDMGYRSIGCEPCTEKVAAGEPDRAGRWAAFEKTECGLHNYTGRTSR